MIISINLIDGRFSPTDAEHLLRDLIQAKINHHKRRIERDHTNEEDVKYSENRIKLLEEELRKALLLVQSASANNENVDLHSKIMVDVGE
jgi:hypothetical protein